MFPRLRRLVLLLPLFLAACAVQVDRLDHRLGLVPPLAEQRIAPEIRACMDVDFTAGLSALEKGDLDAATAAWRRHVEAAPFASPEVREVRGWITLLERERARRFARAAAAGEKALTATPADRLTLALLPFQQVSEVPGDARAFNQAILAMVATDLARVPSLRLLERQRIDALLQELKLSASGLVDAGAALRSGRLLGAGTVLTGRVFNGAPPGPVYTGEAKYTLSAQAADVATGRLLGEQEVYGNQATFFELEKRLVHGILDLLGVKERPEAVDRIHTKNWDAYAQFTKGLSFLAQDRYDDARAAFALALRFDPNFALAETYHLDTPSRALTPEGIREEARRR